MKVDAQVDSLRGHTGGVDVGRVTVLADEIQKACCQETMEIEWFFIDTLPGKR